MSREEDVWYVGDFVELECHDGYRWQGVLADLTEDYVLFASNHAFANGVVKEIRAVPR